MDFIDKVSIFGVGFAGGCFAELYPQETVKIDSGWHKCYTRNILYTRSTTDNFWPLKGDSHKDINVNLIGLMYVLDNIKNSELRKVTTINFLSSYFVYGPQKELPVKEDAICNPSGFYGVSKRCAEQLLIEYCETFNIKWRILRLTNLYGLNDKCSSHRNILQHLVKEIAFSRSINVFNTNIYRDYMWLDDACKAIKLIIDNGNTNEIFNVGTGRPYLFSYLLHVAKKYSNYKLEFNYTKEDGLRKRIQIGDFYLDITKLRNLGWQQTKDVTDFIYEYVDYLKNANKSI